MKTSMEDLFSGTARYYNQFRPKIPREVVDYTRNKYGLDGTGVLLDAGCGTGISTRAFAPFFARTIAFDVSEEMIREAIAITEDASIEYRVCSDDELDLGGEAIKHVIAVRSFHWMDQSRFLQKIKHNMREGGAISIISDGSFWTGQEPWQRTVKEVVQSFLGAERRAGTKGKFSAPSLPYEIILENNGFSCLDYKTIPITRYWTIDNIIGYLYSTSFSAYSLYNNRNAAFEKMLRDELMGKYPDDNIFIENAEFTIQSAMSCVTME